jgi:cellulose synthase/poly-beta-1,6-N-acetylglucosamine synthase-like glycosyltransferase
MKAIEIIFWIAIFVVFYSYLGYGILLFLIIRIRRMLGIGKRPAPDPSYEPEVSLFVAAYNEKEYVDDKVMNHLSLNYPQDKIQHIWITDGSDDGTPDALRKYPQIEVHHEAARGGKIGAINRGMQFVKAPIVIFSDANTNLSADTIRIITQLFSDPDVGCVAGEKRILTSEKEQAAGAGEGIYWKYESTLKKWDAELYSVVGAAGELFAIRRELFEEVEQDTLLDDFIISLRIASKGKTIQYSPDAYAIETASANVKEELKRKVRIAAGGIQSIIRLKHLLNPFKHGTLSFQYISHRVLRWTLAPVALVLIFFINILLAMREGIGSLGIYNLLLMGQLLFYAMALMGNYLENRRIRFKPFFIPYYFFIMNYAVFLGMRRYFKGRQSVNWERAKRAGKQQ